MDATHPIIIEGRQPHCTQQGSTVRIRPQRSGQEIILRGADIEPTSNDVEFMILSSPRTLLDATDRPLFIATFIGAGLRYVAMNLATARFVGSIYHVEVDPSQDDRAQQLAQTWQPQVCDIIVEFAQADPEAA